MSTAALAVDQRHLRLGQSRSSFRLPHPLGLGLFCRDPRSASTSAAEVHDAFHDSYRPPASVQAISAASASRFCHELGSRRARAVGLETSAGVGAGHPVCRELFRRQLGVRLRGASAAASGYREWHHDDEQGRQPVKLQILFSWVRSPSVKNKVTRAFCVRAAPPAISRFPSPPGPLGKSVYPQRAGSGTAGVMACTRIGDDGSGRSGPREEICVPDGGERDQTPLPVGEELQSFRSEMLLATALPRSSGRCRCGRLRRALALTTDGSR